MLLVGAEATSPNVEETASNGTISVYRAVCVETGKLNELSFKADNSNSCTSLVLGIYSEGAEEKPGELLAEGTAVGTPGPGAIVTVTGLDAELVEGVSYWLAFMPLGGQISYLLSVPGTSSDRVSNGGGHTKLDTHLEWFAISSFGPVWMTGHGETPAPPVTVEVADAGAGPASAQTAAGCALPRSAVVAGGSSRLSAYAGAGEPL